MATRTLLLAAISLVLSLPAQAQSSRGAPGGIEPGAGSWKPWVIPSGAAYRVPPPPGAAATRQELMELADLIGRNDTTTEQHQRPNRDDLSLLRELP